MTNREKVLMLTYDMLEKADIQQWHKLNVHLGKTTADSVKADIIMSIDLGIEMDNDTVY